jgi:hypothetical protein
MQFAVVCSSKKLTVPDVELMVAGCAAQVLDFCADWNIAPVAAALYSDISGLPVDDTWPVEILDNLDEPGALGYHTAFGNRPVLRIAVNDGPIGTGITLSHEFLETLADPLCDRWVARGDGSEVAVEVCDPVEGDSYVQMATLPGDDRPRATAVSNYVLPAYFDRSIAGPTDRMGTGVEPFGLRPGGYCVVLGRDGNETEVFARVQFAPGEHANSHARWQAGRRLANPRSRLLRRLKGKAARAA